MLRASKECPCVWYWCGTESGGVDLASLSQGGADKGASWVFKVVFKEGGMDSCAVDLWDDKVLFCGGAPPWSRVSSGDLVDLCLLVVFFLIFVTPPGVFFFFFSAFFLVPEGSKGIANVCGAGVFHPNAEMSICTSCVVFEGAASQGGVSALRGGSLQPVNGCKEGIEPMFDPPILSGGAGHWGGRSRCKWWRRGGS